ncbi:DNA-packaging protein [Bordetella phage vB_BbrM_PHB04]|uniref:DNA-packaging protein n=1 Tax=Bordetella phage vB_BbrM_PHB04 TaxID=2029657 RepID=A0A291LA89_9CAUD|nr:Rz-like spanin [Bordetella phage vB_BbrM_PHB04]ATI15733.1 DNA-packaging protein [Bordetella phage vB_BbrM_PHB04]
MTVVSDAAGAAAKAVARPFLPWLILAGVLLVAALTGGAFYKGWDMRGDREAANQLKAQQKLQAEIDAQRARGDKLAADLELEKRNIKTVTVEVIKEVPKVTKVYVEKPGEPPKAIPPAVYTNGFVRVWDRALRPDLPAAAGEPAGPSGGADLARAPVDSPDILNNHAVNASQYAECRAQLNALITDWESRTGKAKK